MLGKEHIANEILNSLLQCSDGHSHESDSQHGHHQASLQWNSQTDTKGLRKSKSIQTTSLNIIIIKVKWKKRKKTDFNGLRHIDPPTIARRVCRSGRSHLGHELMRWCVMDVVSQRCHRWGILSRRYSMMWFPWASTLAGWEYNEKKITALKAGRSRLRCRGSNCCRLENLKAF